MHTADLLASAWEFAPLLLLGFIAVYLINNKFCQGLNHIPGPWLAGFSDIWRLVVVWGRRPEVVHRMLHAKYGPLVKIGPRTIIVSDPEAIRIIYALNAGYKKSNFYPVQMQVANGRELHSMFNTTDEAFHAKLRRAVSNAYAMSSLVKFEPLVDSTTNAFLKQLKQRFADRKDESGICDLGTWLHYYAFDVIGELTFSSRIGFIDRGVDVSNIIGDLDWLLKYVAVVGQIPWLDRLLLKNPVRMWLSKFDFYNTTSSVAVFARQRISDRQSRPVDHNSLGSKDFLSRFMDAKKKDQAFISDERVLALTVANVFAGSDTTAITLRAIFYYLLRNPESMKKLLVEIGGSKDLISWEESRNLPYLTAVIKEALRIHPAAGLPLERVVPSGGTSLCSTFIPSGTIIGCSAWVIHMNKSVFGEDAAFWRPERWTEGGSEKLALMNNMLFSFGAGSRTCIGKNISLLEMHKLVPAILRSFQIELVNPQQSWELCNAWFVKQSNFLVRITSRD
ncbi:hypothetical protein G6011_10141 [Alternaria panax]|uniref:Pisatin demethylase n=1 Tax=Alternaria panax TaxID=48097 RepID=A0AAD4I618_9PLEO|nr:hypothetical protein G6011_10141 [Alternaria panax]